MESALSNREPEVLGWLATPLTQAEIADELFVSVHTVKSHVRHIYLKLGVSGRREAVECVGLLALLLAQTFF
jgi:LuxR family maltose regulon positive regulatory protein